MNIEPNTISSTLRKPDLNEYEYNHSKIIFQGQTDTIQNLYLTDICNNNIFSFSRNIYFLRSCLSFQK